MSWFFNLFRRKKTYKLFFKGVHHATQRAKTPKEALKYFLKRYGATFENIRPLLVYFDTDYFEDFEITDGKKWWMIDDIMQG